MSKIDWAKKALKNSEIRLLNEILMYLSRRAESESIYPPSQQVFRAMRDLDSARVVILGQDPYHGPGQANGFAFAVNQDVAIPPSLQNIFKELRDDVGEYQTTRTLEHWSDQGVVLLNATLTVERGKPNSHLSLGWSKITNAVIRYLSESKQNLVFILWGKNAQEKSSIIDSESHLVLASPHPSPFSAHTGFFGSRPFSKTNEYLVRNRIQPISW